MTSNNDFQDMIDALEQRVAGDHSTRAEKVDAFAEAIDAAYPASFNPLDDAPSAPFNPLDQEN
ncbi:hypothetical protein HMPREF3159_07970 [Brachybacterium sp. HMSC06H03]|uniref:hypothetical protein n=1 Tax=Brachybacterium sp. HMSC06H03 TaxID=1581127 RepID=UPI0008A3E7C0|nr:hypothetical protein [Brachybacterium sp. HMSC06H03]OFT58152.1 hypothetical protein HMPREF3159_07970 [Brachybacterium sp. HMSC06H03]